MGVICIFWWWWCFTLHPQGQSLPASFCLCVCLFVCLFACSVSAKKRLQSVRKWYKNLQTSYVRTCNDFVFLFFINSKPITIIQRARTCTVHHKQLRSPNKLSQIFQAKKATHIRSCGNSGFPPKLSDGPMADLRLPQTRVRLKPMPQTVATATINNKKSGFFVVQLTFSNEDTGASINDRFVDTRQK